MAQYRFLGCSAVSKPTGPSVPESIEWKAESQFGQLTDTGVRMSLRGEVALCSIGGTEHMAITCGKCGKLSALIKAWSRCDRCGDCLMELMASDLPPSIYRVDWRTGRCEEAKELSRPAAVRYLLQLPSTTRSTDADNSDNSSTQGHSPIGHSRGRGRGALIGMPKTSDAPASSFGGSFLQEGETSGVASGGGSEIGSSQPEPEGNPCSAEQLEQDIKEGETSELPQTDRSWGELVEEEILENVTEPVEEDRVDSTQIIQSAKGLGFDPAYYERRLESSPPRTFKQAVAHNQAHQELIGRAQDSCVPTGKGNVDELPRLSRLQRIVNKRVTLEYGYEYPYVPEAVMDEIEVKRSAWCDAEVWEYLGVPKPSRNASYPKFWEKFLCCRQSWSLGRYIFKDRVVVVKAGRKDQEYAINIFDPKGKMVQVPDPHFYR